MTTLHITYWNGQYETATGPEQKIEKLYHTLAGLRTIRTITMEG